MDRVIHRIPPYILGPEVLLARDITDRVPWSVASRKVPEQWADTKGQGVTVAVLDTGLWKHPDLPSPAFAANFSSSRSVFDSQGHGTHVAGIVGARLDGQGVVGWAPECNIGCVKVLGDDGSGDDAGIARGILYAVEQKANIINLSLGGGFSPRIAEACIEAVNRGVFVICAAGNEGMDGGPNTVGWPARLKETIAIASYRKDGRISDFSSYGPEVDMAFPGEDILSTWINGTFRTISGTSMATPAACGLTALMLAYQMKARQSGKIVPEIKNNADLVNHWQKHATDAGAPGFDNAFGWGIPDVDGIVRGEVSVPPVTPPPVQPPTQPPVGAGNLIAEPMTVGDRRGLFIYVK